MTTPIENNFNVCPMCESKDIAYEEGKKWKCDTCYFTLYNNVATAVGLIIVFENKTTKGKSLLCIKRGREPRKGLYALPGGFVDQDETAERACVREGFEETGLAIESVKFVCSAPNSYEYKGFLYKTCDLFFEAKVSLSVEEAMKSLKAEDENEITDFKLFPINSKEDIDAIPFAFPSAVIAVKTWLSKRHI